MGTTSETSSFDFENSIQFGVEVTVSGGLPFGLAEAETTASMSNTMTFSTGSETTKEVTDSIEVEFTLGPREKNTAFITANEYVTDIPFTAYIEKTYIDGTRRFDQTSGVYRGVKVMEMKVDYG